MRTSKVVIAAAESSNNKALEIFNGTGATVDLTAGSYSLQVFANGARPPG